MSMVWGGSLRLKIEAPMEMARSIAPKGSIVLDGISLTVNEVEGNKFGINIIPITQTATNLGQAKAGDRVNLEIDLIARYVARLLAPAI
jgi:riboflavin synthase